MGSPTDDRPEPVLFGEVGRPLVEHTGRAVRERSVDDVGVAGDPAAVGRAPVDVVVGLDVEHVSVRPRDLGEVPAGRVHDALGLRGRPARVEEVEEVLGVHRLGRAVRRLRRDDVVPPDVATVLHRDVVLRAPQHEAALDRRRLVHRDVGALLQRHHVAATPRTVGRDEELRLGVVDAVAQRVGREPAEHHRVRGADARARQHRDGQLRDHAQVDVDPVALLDAQVLQRVRDPRDLVEQVLVGDRAGVAGLTLPVVRDLVAVALEHVAVDAVVGDVELAADEPLGEGDVPLEDRVPLLEPVDELGRLSRPEPFVVPVGLVVDGRVDDPGVVLERRRRWERTTLGEQPLDRGDTVRHRLPPRVMRSGGQAIRGPLAS